MGGEGEAGRDGRGGHGGGLASADRLGVRVPGEVLPGARRPDGGVHSGGRGARGRDRARGRGRARGVREAGRGRTRTRIRVLIPQGVGAWRSSARRAGVRRRPRFIPNLFLQGDGGVLDEPENVRRSLDDSELHAVPLPNGFKTPVEQP